MINPKQMKELVIRPTLYKLCMLTDELEQLLHRTIEKESNYGSKLVNDEGNGFGIYFMSSAIHNEIWQQYLIKRPDLLAILSSTFNINMVQEEDRLIFDLEYATIMAALQYSRFDQIPSKEQYSSIWNKPKPTNVVPFPSPQKWDPPL